eukprot:980103_1
MSSFIPNSTRKTFIEILLQKQHVASEKGTIPEYLANTSIKQVAWISIYQGHAGIHIHFNAILTNLALNPEWQDRIYREIQEAEPNIKPTPKIHNPDFPILCAFIKESLRDIPGFLIGRRVLKDFNIASSFSEAALFLFTFNIVKEFHVIQRDDSVPKMSINLVHNISVKLKQRK